MNPLLPTNLLPLGMDENENLLIWVDDDKMRKLWSINLKDLTAEKIAFMSGKRAVLDAFIRIKQHEGDKADCYAEIKYAIMEDCRGRKINIKDSIGQGIWRIDGYDDRLLIVSGDHAYWYRDDGEWEKVVFPVIGNRLLDLDYNDWADLGTLRALVDEQTPESCKATWDELAGYVANWKFEGDDDYLLVVGLLFATSIQAVLDFRPQIWITGQSDAGKSGFGGLIGKLLPYYELVLGTPSEAGIRQTALHHSFPIIIDEFEASARREVSLNLMRTGTSKSSGSIIRGTPTGKTIKFRLNHCVWLMSIENSLSEEQANANRFAAFELLAQDRSTRLRKIVRSMPDDLGRRMLAVAIRCAATFREKYRAIIDNEEVEVFRRVGELFAVPLAMYEAVCGISLGSKLVEIVSAKAALVDSTSDHQRLLNHILDFAPLGDFRTIGLQLVTTARRVKMHIDYKKQSEIDAKEAVTNAYEDLLRYGIRVAPLNKYPEHIFFCTSWLKREVLKGTKWEYMTGIREVLSRIVGPDGLKAVKTRNLAAPGQPGSNLPGVLIPRSALGLPPAGRGTPGLPDPTPQKALEGPKDAKPASKPVAPAPVPPVAREAPSSGSGAMPIVTTLTPVVPLREDRKPPSPKKKKRNAAMDQLEKAEEVPPVSKVAPKVLTPEEQAAKEKQAAQDDDDYEELRALMGEPESEDE